MECDHLEKGKGKGQFLGISHFWIDVLGLLPYEGTTFIPNKTFQLMARLDVNFIAVRKYNFLDYFLCCFVYKLLAVTVRNITPQTERTFQSRMLPSLRKSRSVSSSRIACFRFT